MGGAFLILHEHSDYLQSVRHLSLVSDEESSLPCTTATIDNTIDNTISKTPFTNQYPNRTDLVYYVPARGRRDRSGAAILDMLKAQAYSYQQGVAFGGACGDTPHQATNERMIQTAGLDSILKYNCPPTNATDVGVGVRHEMITRDHFFHIPSPELFTDDWLEYIHTQVQPHSKRFIRSSNTTTTTTSSNTNNNDNYTIAVHVRRGDVDPCGHWSFRYLPNSHYLAMIDHYKRQASQNGHNNNVQCQVFSEPQSLLESFDEFTQRGCQVILGGDPTQAWTSMMQANVVILSLSSFSYIPALLNPNAVVAYTPLLSEPLRSNWKWHFYKHANQGWRQWIQKCDDHYKKTNTKKRV